MKPTSAYLDNIAYLGRHLHNSFGFLCLSHCIANLGVCFTFAAWCAPTTVWCVGRRFLLSISSLIYRLHTLYTVYCALKEQRQLSNCSWHPSNFFSCGIFRQNSALADTVEGKRVGQINFLFWNACVYSHLSISINRFICITFPLQVCTLDGFFLQSLNDE